LPLAEHRYTLVAEAVVGRYEELHRDVAVRDGPVGTIDAFDADRDG
jgi:hypothetical protein